MSLRTGLERLAETRSHLVTARVAAARTYVPSATPVHRGPYVAARAIGSFVPSLTRKVFEKHGFSTAALLTDWPRIAGDAVARMATPERLKWPRGEAADQETGRAGATLVLRVDPAHALDIEYRSRQIIDRINTFFGYQAVIAVRLVQAPLENKATIARPTTRIAPASPVPGPAVSPLKAALARLEAGVIAANRRG